MEPQLAKVMQRNFHESYGTREEVEGGSDRAFGLTVGGILIAIALLRWLVGGAGLGWLTGLCLAVGAVLMLLGMLAAHVLAPFNRAWTKLGLLLFRIVSPVVLLLIYAVAVVPTGLALRAGGKDLLRLRREPARTSYWIERRPPGPAPDSMREPF